MFLRSSDCGNQYGGIFTSPGQHFTAGTSSGYTFESADADRAGRNFKKMPDVCVYSAWHGTAFSCGGNAGCGNFPVSDESDGEPPDAAGIFRGNRFAGDGDGNSVLYTTVWNMQTHNFGLGKIAGAFCSPHFWHMKF